MPVPTILELFRFQAPEFAAVADATVQMAIDEAETVMDRAAWEAAEDRDDVEAGAYYHRAVALWAAHILTQRQRQGEQATNITARKVGDLSVSYGAAAEGSSDTAYSNRYAELRRVVYPGAWAV